MSWRRRRGEPEQYKELEAERNRGKQTNKKKIIDFPRLFYLNPRNHTVKGEIPFVDSLRAELKGEKQFEVVTPKRIYKLESVDRDASEWVEKINLIRAKTK